MHRPTLLVTTIAATLFAAACADSSGNAAAAPATGTMVSIDTADTNQYMVPLPSTAIQPLRDAMSALERGDVAALVSNMADSILYVMPDGSEMKGKQVVADYWTNRLKTVVKSLKYTNGAGIGFDVFRTASTATPGKYLMMWYTTEATYQNGKSVTFPAHIAVHLDAAGKFDKWMGYYDTKGISAAIGQ